MLAKVLFEWPLEEISLLNMFFFTDEFQLLYNFFQPNIDFFFLFFFFCENFAIKDFGASLMMKLSPMETNWMSFVAVLCLGYQLLFIKSEFRNAFQVD